MGENVVFLVIFDTCDVVYNLSISLLPPIVLDNLFINHKCFNQEFLSRMEGQSLAITVYKMLNCPNTSPLKVNKQLNCSIAQYIYICIYIFQFNKYINIITNQYLLVQVYFISLRIDTFLTSKPKCQWVDRQGNPVDFQGSNHLLCCYEK